MSMTTRAFTKLVHLGLCSLLGCSSQTSVGEDRCFGENTACTSDAPTHSVLAQQEVIAFDVVATRSVAPLWTFEAPCVDGCTLQLAPGPTPSVWVAVSNPKDVTLLQVDEAGEPMREFAHEPWSLLSVDTEQRPLLQQVGPANVINVVRFEVDGTRVERALPGSSRDVSTATDRRVFAGGAHGGYYVGVFGQRETYVEHYDEGGALMWRQSDLRGARRYPYEDLGPGLVPFMAHNLLPLPDGSLLVELPKYMGEDAAEKAYTQRYQGINLLDRDGNLRWDATLNYAPIPTLTPDKVMTTSSGDLVHLMSSSDVLNIIYFDQTPAALGAWTALRAGYYAVSPFGSCVDATGLLYLLFRAGERGAPRPTLCKVSLSQPEQTAECVGLELPKQLTPAEHLPAVSGSSTSMVCPEPGRVVIASDALRFAAVLQGRNDLLISYQF